MSAKKIRKLKKSDFFTFVVAIIVVAVAVCYYFYEQNREREKFTGINQVFTIDNIVSANTNELQIHFIDVGQGDCIFVDLPDGKNILIDAGNNGKEDIVIDYLNELNVKEITLVIATHSDADHVGGMMEVFEEFEIKYCLRPFIYYNGEYKSEFEDSFNMPSGATKKSNCKTKTYYQFLRAVVDEKCGWEYFNKDTEFTQAFTYQGEDYTYSVDFYTPIQSVPQIGYSDINDYSPIMSLTYGDFCVMFTGDAEKVAEKELVESNTKLPDVDLLKVGHHGSPTSSSIEFLNMIRPEYAVISCGLENSYGHPSQEVIDRLDLNCGATIYRTDLQGHIVCTVSPNAEIVFEEEKFATLTDILTGVKKVEDDE